MIEVDRNIAAEVANDKPAIDADIAAGRVLYGVGREPHKGGCWEFLQEMTRTINAVIKVRRPKHLRILITYDEAAEQNSVNR